MDSPTQDIPTPSTSTNMLHPSSSSSSTPGPFTTPPPKPRPKMKRTECSICARDLPMSVFPILSKKCDHSRETCRKCWNEWLKSQIESVPTDQIACTQCERILEEADIRRLARPASHAAYLDSQFKASMSANPDFHWCIMPTCTSGQFSSGNIFVCVACEVKSCVLCAAEWHEGETCDEYQHRIKVRPDEEEASELEVAKISKMCPGCKTKINKISGCDHMTCSQCREEFCWLCLTDYRGIRQIGNSHHKTNCAHYRPPPNPAVNRTQNPGTDLPRLAITMQAGHRRSRLEFRNGEYVPEDPRPRLLDDERLPPLRTARPNVPSGLPPGPNRSPSRPTTRTDDYSPFGPRRGHAPIAAASMNPLTPTTARPDVPHALPPRSIRSRSPTDDLEGDTDSETSDDALTDEEEDPTTITMYGIPIQTTAWGPPVYTGAQFGGRAPPSPVGYPASRADIPIFNAPRNSAPVYRPEQLPPRLHVDDNSSEDAACQSCLAHNRQQGQHTVRAAESWTVTGPQEAQTAAAAWTLSAPPTPRDDVIFGLTPQNPAPRARPEQGLNGSPASPYPPVRPYFHGGLQALQQRRAQHIAARQAELATAGPQAPGTAASTSNHAG